MTELTDEEVFGKPAPPREMSDADVFGPKGIAVPDGIPAAMEARLEAGAEARKREGGLLQTIPQGIEMISTPEGRTRLWEAVKKYPSKFIDDTINMGKLPGDVAAGKIDLTTEEGMDQAVGLGMLVAGSRFNKLNQTGRTSGLGVAMGEGVSRISKGPTGEIYDLPIGTVARSEDFVTAAQVIAGEDAPMAVQQKMLRAYEEKGLHPSELAHDAMSDPIVAQRLLSSDKVDLPDGGAPSKHGIVFDKDIPFPDGSKASRYSITGASGEKVGVVDIEVTNGGKTLEIVHIGTEEGSPNKLNLGTKGVRDVLDQIRQEYPDAERLTGYRTSGAHRGATKDVEFDLAPQRPRAPPEGSFEAAQKTILDKISVDGAAPKERMTWDRFYTQAVDDLHPLKEVDKGAYDLARLTRGQFGKAEHFLEHGTFDFHTYKTNGKPLKEILAPVRDDLDGVRAFLASKRAVEIEASGRKSGMDVEAAQRVITEGEGKSGKIAEEVVTYQRNALQYLRDSGVLSDEAFTAMTEAGKSYVPFYRMIGEGEMGGGGAGKGFGPGNPVKRLKGSERDIIDPLESIIKNTYAYVSIAERNAVGIKLIDALKADGAEVKVASPRPSAPETVKAAAVTSTDGTVFTGTTHGDAYIAMNRAGHELAASDKGGGFVTSTGRYIDRDQAMAIAQKNEQLSSPSFTSPTRGLHANDLKPYKEPAPKKTAAAHDAELETYLKENGVTNPESLIDFIKSAIPEEGGDTLGAFRNGVKETVKVNDPELVTAFRGLEQSSANMLLKVLAVPAKSLRAGAVLAPDFITRNIVRDFLTAFVNSKGLFSPLDTAKGLVGVIRKDADFLDWLKGGGANSTMVALDRRYMQESLQKLNGETGLMDRAWNVVKHPIDSSLRPLRVMSELAENATRLGEFKKVVGQASELSNKERIQSAAFASREVTLDFAKIGASMRAYNMITAFGAAQINGLDRVGRAFVERPTNTMLKVAGGITLPSVLLWWANKDDQRVKDLPAWQKDMFWIVATKDHLYRIPKPFELGVVFGSGVERILDQTIGNNPEAFDKFSKSVMDIMLPNVMPTFAQPVVEQFANRSTFSDRTLIPQGMEKHLPEYQYTPYTTELSKKLGQVISAFPGMRASAVGPGAPFGPIARTVTSPILLENYVRAWTGGLGVYAMQLADVTLRKTGVLPDPVGPTPTLADIPVVKAFVVRYPSATTQSIQDFYDKHEVAKKFYDTWLSKAKEGDADAMSRIQSAGGPMMFVRLDAIKETLLDHNKLVRDIYKNPTIKPEEKRQLIDSLYFNMIEIGKAGKGMVTQAEQALKTATEAAP